MIAAASSSALFLTNTGQVYATGYQFSNSYSIPTPISGLSAISIAAGSSFWLTAKQDGTVWGWGRADSGQLGPSRTSPSSTPVQISGLTSVKAVYAEGGGTTAFAVKTDGTVWRWGNGSSTPMQLLGLSGITMLAPMGNETLALRSDGTVWLSNGSGATQIAGISSITSIAAGRYHAIALASDGSVWAWGQNLYGQLGDGTTTDAAVPKQIAPAGSVKAISAGRFTSMALAVDGRVWVWGMNNYGELGVPTHSNSPQQVSGLAGIVSIAAAEYLDNFAVAADGTIYGWGNGQYGLLANTGTTITCDIQSCLTTTPKALLLSGGENFSLYGDTSGSTSTGSGSTSTAALTATPSFAADVGGTVSNPILSAVVTPNTADVGKSIGVWVAALYQGNLFFRNSVSGWDYWQAGTSPTPTYSLYSLANSNTFAVLDGSLDASSLFGVEIYVGVGSDFNDMLTHGRFGKIHTLGTSPASNATDHAYTRQAPNLAAATSTTLTLANQIADEDGVRNVYYFLYSDANGANTVASNATGYFEGLTPSTTYYARTIADVYNAQTREWLANLNSEIAQVATTAAVIDTHPDAFAFADVANQPPNTLIESNSIVVSGINAPATIQVSGGEYQINGGVWTSSTSTIANGQTVKVRHTTAGVSGHTVSTVLIIGDVWDQFDSTTGVTTVDTTPDTFTFIDLSGQAVSTLTESNTITVSGINTAASISVTGGEYQINGGAWTSSTGTVTNGQTVKVRHTTSAVNSATTDSTLSIGGLSDTFSTTTVAAANTTPDAFDIPNMTNQALSTVVTTNSITVSGINTSVTASTTVGTLVKNSTDTGSSSTTVSNGDTLAVKLTTSGSYSTAVTGTLTVGTGATSTDNFSVTTLAAADTTPDAFSFTDVTGQALSTLIESNAITVAGINATANISVTGGEYQINGGAWTSSADTVTNGQTVKVRHTSSASKSTITNTTLTIGGVSDTFSSTTAAGTAPTIGDVPNQTGTVGAAFSLALAGYVTPTQGDAITSYQITVGSLPPGLSMLVATGVISGTPTTAGTYNVTVRAWDADGASNSDAIQFVISNDTTPPATPSIAISDPDGDKPAGFTNDTSVTIAITGDTDNVGVTGWFVSESSSSPSAGDAGWSSTKPTTASISSGDGAKTLYVWTKDAAGNVSNGSGGSITLQTP